MPDRIIRDELLESTRWLDLPTDSHRLVFIALITRADDYGNCEGGPRRLFRWMHNFTQIKTEADAIKLMADLQDADLVRRYEVGEKEFWHIPRFRNSRRYWSRKHPKSPYKENDTPTSIQQDAKNTTADLRKACANLSGGVGVGVGVGEGLEKGKDKTTGAIAPFVLPDGIPPDMWADFLEMRKRMRKPPTVRALWLLTGKLFNLEKEGYNIRHVLQQSIRNGWQDVFPIREERVK